MAADPDIDAYLAALSPAQRGLLEHVRGVIADVVPDAEQAMSYGMPAFKRNGKFFLSYAGWKRHCSIYPLPDAFLAEHRGDLEGYRRTKGSLHFTPERPLPDEVIRALVRHLLARSEAGSSY
jgi:uncharacterized protein YdhG (YjbR/CyaY superfamily)